MTAFAALKSITFDEEGFVSCASRAMSMPLKAVALAKRTDDWLATSLKLTGTECLFDCGFNPALNCCDSFVHNDLEVAEQGVGQTYVWSSMTRFSLFFPCMGSLYAGCAMMAIVMFGLRTRPPARNKNTSVRCEPQ